MKRIKIDIDYILQGVSHQLTPISCSYRNLLPSYASLNMIHDDRGVSNNYQS